jgi:beta-glucanase (GH16 family)
MPEKSPFFLWFLIFALQLNPLLHNFDFQISHSKYSYMSIKKTFLLLFFYPILPITAYNQNTTLFSDNFETPQLWTIFEEIVSGNTCYGSGIGEVARSTDVAHGGTNALRVWSNKTGVLKSNHVIAAHTISNTQGIIGHLRYGMWAYCNTNLDLTQSGPEFSVQSTRTVGAQNLTYIAGVQYIGNQWVTDKWQIWHNGTWKTVKLSEFGATLAANTWYYLELEFDMTTNKYLSLKIQGGVLNATLDLTQAFQNAPLGFEIGAETRSWTPSYFVTTESENLWTTCAEVRENKIYYDDVLLESIVPPTAPTCYQLVWADEFNGSALDLTKWTPIVGEGGAVSGNAELQYYTNRSQNIEVSKGALKIIALQETYGGNAYTSARMQSKNLGDWLYGRMEARIKLPVAQGMWPAFWMLPTENAYGVWPKSGEIDIMELIGREPSHIYGTIHSHDNGMVKTFSSVYNLPSGTFGDDFHVFSVEWSPTEIKFYVDNNLYATKNSTTISPYPWVFDKRFYLLLNLAIGGPWAGAPDGTTSFPQQMEVDYVRVYQKLDNIGIVGNILVEPATHGVTYSEPAISGTTYLWTVSGSGSSLVSGQNTNQITVNWGNTSGTVSVLMNDGCVPSATIATPVTVSANLWSNPNFEQDYVAWDTRPAYSATVDFNIATTLVAEGTKSACVQVNTVGANPWNTQLSRTNLDLIGGTAYSLTFKAKADANRTIPIAFIRSSDFSGITYQSINLTTAWQTYSLNFTPTTTVNAMFNADLAAQLGTYCFDDFVFARSSVLPIRLLNFQGLSEIKGNRLTWYFANLQEIKDFEIQKSSDGKIFTPLSILTAQDDFFLDTTPFKLTYYQLKIKDLEDKVTYSDIITLVNAKNASNTEGVSNKDFVIFPNPTSQGFTLQFQDETAGVLECRDILGRLIFLKKLNPLSSVCYFSVKEEGLSAGIYFLKTHKVGTIAQRLIIGN